MARQFNLIPPVCEQAEYHYFQRDKVEVQLPELYHKIGPVTPLTPPIPTHSSTNSHLYQSVNTLVNNLTTTTKLLFYQIILLQTTVHTAL